MSELHSFAERNLSAIRVAARSALKLGKPDTMHKTHIICVKVQRLDPMEGREDEGGRLSIQHIDVCPLAAFIALATLKNDPVERAKFERLTQDLPTMPEDSLMVGVFWLCHFSARGGGSGREGKCRFFQPCVVTLGDLSYWIPVRDRTINEQWKEHLMDEMEAKATGSSAERRWGTAAGDTLDLQDSLNCESFDRMSRAMNARGFTLSANGGKFWRGNDEPIDVFGPTFATSAEETRKLDEQREKEASSSKTPSEQPRKPKRRGKPRPKVKGGC